MPKPTPSAGKPSPPGKPVPPGPPGPPGKPGGAPSKPLALRTPSPRAEGTTLLEILQRKNPEFEDRIKSDGGGNTTSATNSYDRVLFNDDHPTVQKWTDFTFEAIQLAYGHILGVDIKTFRPDYEPVKIDAETKSTRIYAEGDIENMGRKWSREIVNKPLWVAATYLRSLLPSGASPEPSLEAKGGISWQRPLKRKNVTFNPDWTIRDEDTKVCYREHKNPNEGKFLVFVVGDTKVGQKWKSAWLGHSEEDLKAQGREAVTKERRYPLEQVATYCRYAQTRYAFVLTQDELVALRIRRIDRLDPGQERHFAAVEYAPVSWHATSGLTANLAIWALGCMGMNDAHREMESADGKNQPLDKMARLTWWKKKGAFYENVISKRQIRREDWNHQHDHFVCFDEVTGNSPTDVFYPRYGSVSGASSRASTPPHPGTKRPAPSRSTSPPDAPPQKTAAVAPPGGAKLTAKPSAKPSATPATATAAATTTAKRAAVPASRGSSAASSSGPPEKQCVINTSVYKATYSSDHKKYLVKYKSGKYPVVVKGRKYYIEVRDETLEVKWVPES